MNTMTVSEVSRAFNVSTRMLRYYEKAGLIYSTHKEDYSYRVFEEEAVRRLQLLLILRKLRIPVKQIEQILADQEQKNTLQILVQQIENLNDEISSLCILRDILNALTDRLDENLKIHNKIDLLEDKELIAIADTLQLSKNNLKEAVSMNEVEKANETLDKGLEVRLIQLPPFTVASFQYVGENPEDNAHKIMNQFMLDSKLYDRKPDARYFGFNHPNPSDKQEYYGYEVWVTIPDDLEVPAPLAKKKFTGGLYAAHAMEFPNFQEWELLSNWVNNSDQYQANYSELGEEIMGGCLEEHLNWVYSNHMGWPENGLTGKLDLLLPVKAKIK